MKNKDKSNNEPSNQNSNKSNINENLEHLSVKEQIKGVATRPLPKDFFEKVLENEMKLKEKFDIETLANLIKYYSLAVEYYQSINDPKYMEYNENLNLLFKQMEVKRYMKEGTNLEANVKKEEIKKEMKTAEKEITNTVVEEVIKKNAEKSAKNGKQIVINDIENQRMSFKKRLMAKKKKFIVKINFENDDNNDGFKKIKSAQICEIKKNNNKKQKKENNEIKNDNKIIEEDDNISNEDSVEDKEKNLINEIGNSSNNEKNNKNSEINESEFLLSIESGSFIDSSSFEVNFSQSAKILPNANKLENNKKVKLIKKNKFKGKIKENFYDYIQGYFDYFMDNCADEIIEIYENNAQSLSKELIESEVNYYNQEKQMSYLVTNDDSDHTYEDQIKNMINGIRAEKEKNYNDIIQKNEEKLKEINKKYIYNLERISDSHDIQILKEKIKCEITKDINEDILK